MWSSDINVTWKIDAIEYFMILCSLGVVHICQVSRKIVQDFLTKLEANPENPMHIISVLKSVYKCRASLFLFVFPSSLERNITKNILKDFNGFERDCWMAFRLYVNFRQARINYFCDICVVFARNCKIAHLTQYKMQYMPWKSALLA